ncbi:MAG: preprotein translocase subunit SecY [Bifidobacteriaceae bacterium]|nr:preprotein translocase subunit SecY [Bifidobacteriaceae bacterium]
MLGTFAKAFRTPDLRRKLLFTIGIIVVYRLGCFIPCPGVNYGAIKAITDNASDDGTAGVLSLINLFSGGALLTLSVFALGIMPYITASIIIQLLRVVIPRFEALHKEGQAGTSKLTQYTRYLTIALAILQSTVVITSAKSGQLFSGSATSDQTDALFYNGGGPMTVFLMIVTMTAGTGMIMWLGELITERGVGNGMSLLIFASIVSGFPGSMSQVLGSNNGTRNFVVVLLVFVGVIGAIVFVEQCQRRIPVQYAKRMVGRRTYGGSSTYIPIKINIAGVIPVIFASSLLSLPYMVVQFAQNSTNPVVLWIAGNLRQQDLVYMVLYGLLIIFFCFFYTSITFNPEEVADNMKRYGGFIPGIRAGRPTAEYLQYVISRITTSGSLYLAIVALIPQVMFSAMGVYNNLPFGGTTLLIIVGVGLDTVKQIESQLQQRHYEGFLR